MDEYDNIVSMVTGMLCALPVTIYLNNSFQNVYPRKNTPTLFCKKSRLI